MPRECKTITEILKEDGYNTLAINANPLLTFYREYWRGFDICNDPLRAKKRNRFLYYLGVARNLLKNRIMGKPFLPYPSPEEVGNEALSLLKNAKTPFFLWLHHVSVHVPYYPPKKFLSKISLANITYSEIKELDKMVKNNLSAIGEADVSKIKDLYDAEVMNVDNHIGEFMQQLEEMGVDFNNTYFIITSDHGDEFREHGGFIHSEKLYEELIRVPLIIAGPGLKPCKITEQVSLLSLPPTILSLAVNKKSPDFLGHDLLSLMEHGTGGEDYVICEGCQKDKPPNDGRAINKKIACRTHSWKYIYSEDGREELYNLPLDPEEKTNLRDQETNIAKHLKQKITEHLEMEEKVAAKIKEKKRIKERIKHQSLNPPKG
jgi:arylsulfatase A-like enzyme